MFKTRRDSLVTLQVWPKCHILALRTLEEGILAGGETLPFGSESVFKCLRGKTTNRINGEKSKDDSATEDGLGVKDIA